MIGATAITVINNARRGDMTEVGLWLAIAILIVAIAAIAIDEWRHRRRKGPR